MNNKVSRSLKLISYCIDALRPLLGPRGVCIYPVTCRCYAKNTLQQKPLYLAIPLITLRLLSCNPITAIFLRRKYKKQKKERT